METIISSFLFPSYTNLHGNWSNFTALGLAPAKLVEEDPHSDEGPTQNTYRPSAITTFQV
jgi:hypothetical protein